MFIVCQVNKLRCYWFNDVCDVVIGILLSIIRGGRYIYQLHNNMIEKERERWNEKRRKRMKERIRKEERVRNTSPILEKEYASPFSEKDHFALIHLYYFICKPLTYDTEYCRY